MSKTHIYLIRHGQSEGNHRRAFLGHTDLGLTQMGHIQAENTAVYLENITPDVIYSSDLKRAYSTALHTAQKKDMEVIKSEKLREIFAGQWENHLFDDLVKIYSEDYDVWKNNIGLAKCTGGESVADLAERIMDEVRAIAKRHEGQTVFIFTHATPIRALKTICDGKSLSEMKDVPWATNASVTYAVCEDGKMTVVDYGIDDFQGEERTTLPKNV